MIFINYLMIKMIIVYKIIVYNVYLLVNLHLFLMDSQHME